MLVIPLEHIVIIAGLIFALGLLGVMRHNNILRLLLAVEAMFNAAAFGFIGTAVHFGHIDGHIMFLLILGVASAEVCIALAIVLNYDRLCKTLDISLMRD